MKEEFGRALREGKSLRALAKPPSEKPFSCLPRDLLGIDRMMHFTVLS